MFRHALRNPRKGRPSQSGRRARLLAEPLEDRRLLATVGVDPVVTPAATLISSSQVSNPFPPAGAVTPSTLGRLYSLNQSASSGSGITIAIVDAYNDPNIRQDLAVFDAQYGLPAANLTVVNQNGGSSLPATDAGWSLEIAMDVEWAHASAPGASIVLVEANSANVSDLFQAVKTASGLSNVVSMSWGSSEFQGQQAYDGLFSKSYVTFVAASGDDGGASGAEWPAASPYVVGVGGTTLSGSGETAWNGSSSNRNGYSGSAGGTSTIYSLPAFQAQALSANYSRSRATPDVASLGNPSTGLAVYDSVPGAGSTGWAQVGGTSAGAPVWAGIIATADVARWSTGRKTLGSSETLTMLYGLSETNGSISSSYSSVFHDITSGSNYAGSAVTGYDLVTGLGSPIASNIVSNASRYGLTWAQIMAASLHTANRAAAVTTARAALAVTNHDEVLTASIVSTMIPIGLASQNALEIAPTTAAAAVPSSVPGSLGTVSTAALAVPALSRPTQAPAQSSWDTLWYSSNEDDRRSGVNTIPKSPGIFLDPLEAPTPDAAAPMLARPLTPPETYWDAALSQVASAPASSTVPEPVSPPAGAEILNTEETDDDRAVCSSALSALAFAVWGTWENRSRKPERERDRAFGFRPETDRV